MQETWLGYCPFSVVLGHDTANCIVAPGVGACSRGPQYGQQPYNTATKGHDNQPSLKGVRQRARTQPGHGVSRDTIVCIVDGGDLWCGDTAQQGCDIALRHGV